MIQIQSEGGKERAIRSVFVCDICKQPILELGKGAAVFRDHGLGEGELYSIMHVHKGQGHDIAEEKLQGGKKGSLPWHEHSDHVNDICAGMGVTIRGMIDREVGWTGTLKPSQQDKLRRFVGRLGDWLRRHGVASPLWN